MAANFRELPDAPKTASLLPSWRSTWAIDLTTGKRKVVLIPCTPSGRSGTQHTPAKRPKVRHSEVRTPEDRVDEALGDIVPYPRVPNMFNWKSTPSGPTHPSPCSGPTTSLTNVKRRVWLPSLYGVHRPKIVFMSSGTAGVRITDFIFDPRIMDNYYNVRPIREQNIKTVKVTISWPGYEEFSQTFDMRKILCCGDLFHKLSRVLLDFVSHASKAISKDQLWAIGPQGISVKDIWIVGFGYSHCGHWTPVIEVEV